MRIGSSVGGVSLLGAVLFVSASFVASEARAQLTIEVKRFVDRPIPIAVVPFGWAGGSAAGGLGASGPSGSGSSGASGPGASSASGARGAAGAAPFDLAALVARDLENSGRFDAMDVADMLSRPTRPAEVNIQDWRITKTDALVIGTLSQTGPDAYSIEFQLFDIVRGRQLLGFRLTSNRMSLRQSGHKIADMVFEALTGTPGVFSTQIAYISEQRDASGKPRYRLIVADADGENATTIADSPLPLMSPAWSPDGRRIAYVSFENNQSAIWVQTLRTGNRERVSARAGVNGAPSFSPDGRMLALTLSGAEGNLDIYTLDLATQVLRRLTQDPAIDTEPSWAPDGKSIYFTSDRSGGAQVYRIAAEPGRDRPQRVTFEGTYNTRPRAAPNGKDIAVVHRDGQQNDRIAIVNVESGLTQVLSDGRLDEAPDFAPNGALLIYATRDAGKGVLQWVSSDGRIQQEIASGAGDVREPVWSPFPRP